MKTISIIWVKMIKVIILMARMSIVISRIIETNLLMATMREGPDSGGASPNPSPV